MSHKERVSSAFGEFAEALQDSEAISRDPERRREFLDRYKFDISYFAISLNDLLITGGEGALHPGGAVICDLCGNKLLDSGFFIDGATKDGTWANMCPKCFASNGSGIGWGVGQFYRAQITADRQSTRWMMIAGGNPFPREE